MTIHVTEYSLSTGKPTGKVLHFSIRSGPLYTARIADRRATLGPSKRVLYPHGPESDTAWVADKKLKDLA